MTVFVPAPAARRPVTRRPVTRRLLAIVAVSVVLLVALSAPAFADTSIPSYSAAATLSADGTLRVEETVTYDFGGDPTTTITRELTTREDAGEDRDRVYEISDIDVQAVQGAEADFTVTSEDSADVVEVSFAEQADSLTLVFSYDVTGTVVRTPDGVEMRWPLVQGFDAAIDEADAAIQTPQPLWIACYAGPPGSLRPCTLARSVESPLPTVEEIGVPAGGQMTVVLGFGADTALQPNAAFDQRFSLARAFTVSPLTLAISGGVLGMLALGALALWLLRGRDQRHCERWRPGGVAPLTDEGRFVPPDEVRPGEMGTVVDERADVVDLTATVMDLAVRGHLFVEELPHPGFDRIDWRLYRRAGDGALLPYEKAVLDGLFADRTDSVLVSELPRALEPHTPVIQDRLYAEMVTRGWFRERPDVVRSRWTTAGLLLVGLGVVLTVALAVATTLGLLGVALVLGGVALGLAGQAAPSRTASGSTVTAHLHELRDWLADSDPAVVSGSDQSGEVMSRIVPYAVVFGSEDRWAAALAESGQAVWWYGGPPEWQPTSLAGGVANLVAALDGAISASRRLFS